MTWDGSGGERGRFGADAVEPVAAPAPRSPRIGLALGGGSARGWSHIGAIEVLEESGIHPGVVTGCSIGAVVGGCYAAGQLGLLKTFALSLTKRRVVGLLDLRLGSGLIAGARLRQRLERDLADRRVEHLAVRFASVATDLGSGEEVWLTRGNLVEALRASYALPGVFPPVRLGGRLLMDGTLVNPVPVGLARALGADVVICINLNGDPREAGGPVVLDPDERADEARPAPAPRRRRSWALFRRGRRAPPETPSPGMARVMLDAFNITQDKISRARLAGDPPDVTISPRLAEMGLFEFHRAAEGIELGRQAARAALPAIRATLASAAARV
ncbi:NTE family protein rssA [Methylobacterium sp. Leaf469]|uniref:patatin-like phospholipase family protein n=1 Tax=unclassified Methylobacterium TaxID=2615210 RepID=UPI0006F5E1BB|nr:MULTISPECIES: patatin-like phospholipase family protein [unclassified Methylobacterium]USU31906.1 patatin-like phospholipase family protein [Methylobacterium sp. OTU13CASTA1]KQO70370.1 NTE family protein rssA [Methylobacterium sp. Leaf87]KQP32586.1 NTE family protein rssA [Methylobacterium sp. Leaf102]KQP33197.1 NTE family protein rssA [Methylobacterium sp. Leaf100]KQU02252.1 NTE family protein rssA [Methylobacterium sp. Leaf469]